MQGAGATLSLTERAALTLVPDGDRWSCALEPDGEAGAAEQLVEHLRRGRALPDGEFRLSRHAVPPAASGERPIEIDRANNSVVVGERVVVTWMRHVTDASHPAPTTLAHLAETGFKGVPKSYGVLLWRTPSGREVPCAVVRAYLPGARDGWDWAVELIEQAIGAAAGDAESAGPADPWAEDFVAHLGELAARLHCELAVPSNALPEPTGTASAAAIRSWQQRAVERLEAARAAVTAQDRASSEPDADVQVSPARVFAESSDRIAAAIDGLADLTGGTSVQRIHGDLHVGRILRWSGGFAIVDVGAAPQPAGEDDHRQPPARDVAQLLVSLDQAARAADQRSGFTRTDEIDEWSARARAALLTAYRAELAAFGRPDLFDERLLAPFIAEQVCQNLLNAEHPPHVVTSGLRALVPEERGSHVGSSW